MNYHLSKGEFMPDYLNLFVIFRYDFIVTYLAVVFLIQWILTNLRLKRFRHALWRVWESRNRQILRRKLRSVERSNKG